jgi:uncharacterized spore protein YtfJ
VTSEQAIADITRIPDRAGAATCFGAAVTSGDHTVIPVADVAYAFGFGYGRGHDAASGNEGRGGGGGGGGARSRGVAVIDVSPQGVRILPIEDQTSIRLASITLATASTAIVARTLLKLLRG